MKRNRFNAVKAAGKLAVNQLTAYINCRITARRNQVNADHHVLCHCHAVSSIKTKRNDDRR